ncbi:MAG: hypothetical protein HY812_20085 [Planctomycetes bacterium]|nr:hypothetical protein [Planctomycetota bacterium]
MTPARWRPTLGVLAAAALLAGCLPTIEVRTRTRILQDGTVLRETRLVKIRSSTTNDQDKPWNKRPISEDLGKRLGEGFASLERSDDEILLSGVFPPATPIPPDFRRDVAVLEATSENHAEVRLEDILFGVRFLYRERYADAIVPEDQDEARAELIAFTTRFLKSAVRCEFGASYDYAAFNAWTDEKVAPLLKQLIEIYWSERRALGRSDPFTRQTGLERGLKRALERIGALGLKLDADQDEPHNMAAVRVFLGQLLAAKLTPKDPKARRLAPADFAYLVPEEKPLAALELALERAAVQEFGSADEATKAFQRRLLGVTGTYGSPPAEAEFRFDCAVEMPGMLLSANGYLESARSAFWLFDGQEIFPHGYVLEAESVVLDGARLGRIRELKTELGSRDAVRLIQRLEDVSAADRAAMGRLLDECARQGTLAALVDGADDPERKRIQERLGPVLDALRRE